MTHKERLKRLEEWQKHGEDLEAATEQFRAAVGACDIERSPILKAAWGLWDEYTAVTAQAVGDTDSWLQWWWYENDRGAKGLKARAAKWTRRRPIRTLADLCKLIEADL